MMPRFAPLFLIAVLMAACAAPQATDMRLAATNLGGYQLDSGDKVRVTVFGQMDLSGEYNVDGSGQVALPLVEPVEARGMTPEQLGQRIEAILGQKLLRNPAVSVEVTQYRPFFILGEVNRPGQYPYVNGMSVQTAAAIAGGFTYRANTSDVTITRHVGKNTLEGTAAPDAVVMPGDTILVKERYF
jgi:polysaccharide export outer membrane protein